MSKSMRWMNTMVLISSSSTSFMISSGVGIVNPRAGPMEKRSRNSTFIIRGLDLVKIVKKIKKNYVGRGGRLYIDITMIPPKGKRLLFRQGGSRFGGVLSKFSTFFYSTNASTNLRCIGDRSCGASPFHASTKIRKRVAPRSR